MKKTLFFLLLSLPLLSFGQKKFAPVANPKAIVVAGNARFTVLSPTLIRMEWDSLGMFEDNASLVVINRDQPVPRFATKEDKKQVQITTDKLVLKYKKSAGAFSAANLQIEFTDPKNKTRWTPASHNKDNLLGTARTLDDYNGATRHNGDSLRLENGIISRDGWYVIDDSKSYLFDNSEWPWAQARTEGKRQDLYFFGYAKDYKAALKDFTHIAGKIPMPPKYAFGYWWSRYYSYTDKGFRELVANMEQYDIPMDVLVVDMDWHRVDGLSYHNAKRDEFGQSVGWTGFSWNKSLLPNPTKFLKWTADKKLNVTLNLHPASGIAPSEDSYAAFAKAMDFDTIGQHNIPFEIGDKKFATTYFETLLRPLEKQGVDFWWIDWQQWQNSKKLEGLNNTWWLNYCHFTDMERQGKQRPLLYHRWGGLGNHRYQIGFSGDTWITWQSLAYQPYFTATASNVAYGYWSHDIGGHMWGGVPREQQQMQPELSTRWVQFGVFSPILRNHSGKELSSYKEPWLYPYQYTQAIHDAINLRYSLFPYIYTAAREAYDEGISIMRPMYYQYPDAAEAYTYKDQYFFGNDMLVSPVTAPASLDSQLAKVKIWLPEGNWYEWFTGTMLSGGKKYEREFLLTEIPVYVKAGAIIPLYPKVKNLKDSVKELGILVFPGGNFETKMYEDNGLTNTYTESEYAFTTMRTVTSGNAITLSIAPRTGTFEGALPARAYHAQFIGSLVPDKVVVAGKEYSYATPEEAKAGNWTYTAADFTLHVYLPETSVQETTTVNVLYPSLPAEEVDLLNGRAGLIKRYNNALDYLKIEYNAYDLFAELPDVLTQAQQITTRIQYEPQSLLKELKDFDANTLLRTDAVYEMKINQKAKDIFFQRLNHVLVFDEQINPSDN